MKVLSPAVPWSLHPTTKIDMNRSTAAFESKTAGEVSTIAALATPPGISGIAVIRLSGPRAAEVCDLAFKPGKSFPKASEMEGYTMSVGRWTDPEGTVLDQVVLAAFRAPKSYTGEDLYEISCHGGLQVRRSILESLYAAGVLPAGPGEFSKRAFINGKMDLMQAEAVMDLIHAESELQQKTAVAEIGGALSKAVGTLSAKLYGVQAHVELILEFPEHEDTPEASALIRKEISELKSELELALEGWKQGRILQDGFHIAIAGLPNAGKSSLLNAILGEDRAIVNKRAGTTRDTLEARAQIGGVPVVMTDTAGLREGEDEIEKEGVERAVKAVEKADLILWLHDPERSEESFQTLDELSCRTSGQQMIFLAGKQDLDPQGRLLTELRKRFADAVVLPWSVKQPDHLRALRQEIEEACACRGASAAGTVLIHNLRHKQLLEACREHLDLAMDSMDQGLSLDLTAGMLRAAQEDFAALSGTQVSDALAEEIFSRFCVGK